MSSKVVEQHGVSVCFQFSIGAYLTRSTMSKRRKHQRND